VPTRFFLWWENYSAFACTFSFIGKMGNKDGKGENGMQGMGLDTM
jgi:hypothetical protein